MLCLIPSRGRPCVVPVNISYSGDFGAVFFESILIFFFKAIIF